MNSYNYKTTIKANDSEIPVHFAAENVAWLARQLRDFCGAKNPRVLLVTDERVALHYEPELLSALHKKNVSVVSHVLPVGESRKNLSAVESIVDTLAEHTFARDDLILAFGGGVVTDIAGFAAAIYKRGIPWLAAPTSLLGMVDAAIGGKTGVDHLLGKNLIGAFHQPQAIFAPLQVLETLDEREWLSGSAEVVKSALLTSGDFWPMIEKNGANLNHWEREQAYHAIIQAAQTKIKIVEQDVHEHGPRKLLNLGHTFGHALETATNYSAFRHGEAVFWGLAAMTQLSQSLGLLDKSTAKRINQVIAGCDLPRTRIEKDKLLAALAQDKKISAGKIQWILLRNIGNPIITTDASPEAIANTAQWLCEKIHSESPMVWQQRRKHILVLHGPNLNLLGEREPEIYGRESEADVRSLLQKTAQAYDGDVMLRQSNHEGELVDLIQRARHWADGIIINAGGFTHTSVAIRDAISAVKLPTIEIHLSDLSQREDFRKKSLLRDVCLDSVTGQGIHGYVVALERLFTYFKQQER